MIVDLCAGSGGWDEGLRILGRTDVIGVESDATACATARAAGHERRQADVSALPPATFADVEGIIGSPPCQGFSPGGLKLGRDDLQMILDLLACTAEGHDHRADYLFEWADAKSALMVEPMRWLNETGARWLVLEQVPAALPVWEDYADHLLSRDWFVDVAVLNASDYGVPQDRTRAVLIAHQSRPVTPPAPGEKVPASSVVGPGLLGFPRLNDRPDGGKYRARDLRSTDLPCFTVTEKARSWSLIPEGGDARLLTASEAGRLQSFRGDYPWQGTRSRQFLQLANAVPPLMAAEILRCVL